MSPVTPKVDIVFKKLFGVEENKDLLMSLINSIVSEEDQVQEITLLNPYNPQSFKNDKLSILDVKAKNKEGQRYNIEIQITDEADYDKRALYYWAKLYTEQLQIAEDYSTLSKAIGIHILNFTSIPKQEKYHNVFHIVEKETKERYFKDLELHTIELKKFSNDSKEQLPELIKRIKKPIDMWVAFLTRHDLLKRNHLPREIDRPELNKALGVLDTMSFDSEERDAYEGRLKWIRMINGMFKKHPNLKELMELDKEYDKGVERGIGKRNIQIAKKMLAKNKSINDIIELTELSIEQINNLKER